MYTTYLCEYIHKREALKEDGFYFFRSKRTHDCITHDCMANMLTFILQH